MLPASLAQCGIFIPEMWTIFYKKPVTPRIG